MTIPKKINWDDVDKLLTSGCTGTEVAGFLGIHPETLYDRTVQEKGTGFSDYSQQKRSHGKSLLRAKQYDKALKGDTTLLIWLGKVSLDQIEKKDAIINEEDVKIVKEFVKQISSQKTVEVSMDSQLSITNSSETTPAP
jgi:hypothetical protein